MISINLLIEILQIGIMETLNSEKVTNLFTTRIGVLSVVLQFFGYAHQGVYLVNSLWRASRKMLTDYPFEFVLKSVRYKHEVIENGN